MPSFREHVETFERWRLLPGRERLEGDEPAAALTFDDGPDPDATPAVLDALEAAGAKATFFVLGEQVGRHPELARTIAERGHEVGLHGFHHVRHDRLGAGEAQEDLERGVATVEAAAGVRPARCRPPFGRFSADSHAACAVLALEPVYWSAWGSDWETLAAERIAELVARDLATGAIVLLHDSARYAVRQSAEPTAAAVPLIAERASGAGLRLVSMAGAARPPRL